MKRLIVCTQSVFLGGCMRAWIKVGARSLRFAVVSTSLIVLTACVTNPPYQEMSDARQAITAAEEAGADIAKPNLVRLAKRHMNNAREAMRERRFNAARNEAILAHRKAAEALEAIQPDTP